MLMTVGASVVAVYWIISPLPASVYSTSSVTLPGEPVGAVGADRAQQHAVSAVGRGLHLEHGAHKAVLAAVQAVAVSR